MSLDHLPTSPEGDHTFTFQVKISGYGRKAKLRPDLAQRLYRILALAFGEDRIEVSINRKRYTPPDRYSQEDPA